MSLGHLLQPLHQRLGIADLGKRKHEALEIVVLMLGLMVVVRGPRVEIVFRRGTDPKQRVHIDPPFACRHHLDRARDHAGNFALEPRRLIGVDQVALVEDHEIGGHELVLIDFGQRVVVFDGRIELLLAGDRLGIVGEAPRGNGRRIDHGDHAVDRQPRFHIRPFEGLDQRLGQSEPRGLDQNMLGRVVALDQRPHGRQKIFGDGAAETSVGQLDDILLVASLDAAAAQGLAVDAEAAELVDDQREAPPIGVLQHMTQQRGFTSTEKPGDDGRRDTSGASHSAASLASLICVGKRATTVLRDAGRRERNTTPVSASAYVAL